jgi:hypothetical protein
MILLVGGLVVACENKKSVRDERSAPVEESSAPAADSATTTSATTTPATTTDAEASSEATEPKADEQGDETTRSTFASSKKELLRAAFEAAATGDVDAWSALVPEEAQLNQMCASYGDEPPSPQAIEEGASRCKETFAGHLEGARAFVEKNRWGISQEGALDEEAGAQCEDFEVYFFQPVTYDIEGEDGLEQLILQFPTVVHHDGQWSIIGAPRCMKNAPG